MSSTSNVQNLLTNVFRPTFIYNTVTSNYQTKLELTNVDTVSANTVSAFAADVGDASGNVYVGIGAGNAHSVLSASSNTTNTFVGTGAGGATSNVKNAVFLGYRAGYGVSNSSNSISIGANTLNGGNSNVYIGCGTGIATGSNNIFIGPGISNGGTSVSNTLLIGSGSNTLFRGDLASNRVGINTTALTDPSTYITLDVNGYTRIGGPSNNGNLGINTLPGTYTLDVNGNMRVSDGYGLLAFSNDSLGVSRTSISGIVPPVGSSSPAGQATLQVSDGFLSMNGSIEISNGTSSNIGTLKRGIVMISAEDSRTTSNVSASKIFMATLSNGTFVTSVVGTSSNLASITSSLSNIVLSNIDSNTHTFTYSITYFPSVATSLAGQAIVNLEPLGSFTSFVAKYNAAGVVQWAARLGGSADDYANSVTVDLTGNVIVAGSYASSPLTIYNSDGSAFATTLANSGSYDSFIAKYSSEGVVQWVARQSGTGSEFGRDVAVDSAGNVIVAGSYASSTLTVYSSNGSAFATTLANSGGHDSFIAKYNSAGIVQWVARQAGTADDYGRQVAVDSAGNVIVAGYYASSTLTIYSSNGSAFATTLANSGGNDSFIAKYNSAGIVQWVARQAGTANDAANSVAVDSAGNVIVAGYYASSTLTIYNSDGSAFATTLNYGGTGYDSFIAKYNSAGIVQWVARQAGTANDAGYSVAVDSAGNVIVAGFYESSPLTIYNSDGSAFATTLANSGYSDSFIAKYNSAGIVQWVARQSGTWYEYASGVTVDSAGNIIVTGSHASIPLTVYSSNGSPFPTTLSYSGSGNDSFIAKYNSAGIVQWVAKQAGAGDDNGQSVAVDSASSVLVAGYYDGYSYPLSIYNA